MMAMQHRGGGGSQGLMLPPPPRPPQLSAIHLPGDIGLAKAVLSEEDYTEGVAAIIERDYFPDIPKLRSQLEWSQAVKSGDPNIIRQAQINIARRRAGLLTPRLDPSATPNATPGRHSNAPGTAATPSGWGVTPAVAPLHTPSMTPLVGSGGATPMPHGDPSATPGASAAAAAAVQPVSQLRAPPVSLDTFLATHTSEDNASFARIQAKDIIRKRRRVAHHLVDNNQPLLLEGPGANPSDGYGTGGQQPLTLVPTKHNPHNALYYPPDQKPLNAREAEDVARRPAKAINIRGTRLKPADDEVQAGPTAAGQAGGRGAQGEFSRLATPAFTPGMMGESPLMTWGDIASTPLRLDGEDLFGPGELGSGSGAGPTFTVPNMPRRELAGHQLAAAKTVKEYKKRQRETKEAEALAAALPPGAGSALAAATGVTPRTGQRPWSSAATPTPKRMGTGGVSGGAGAGLAGMSEAAQRLVRQVKVQQARMGTGLRKHTPASDTDRQLRASYSSMGTQAARTPAAAAAATPGQGGAVQAGKAATVKHVVRVGAAATDITAGKSITDDLLHF